MIFMRTIIIGDIHGCFDEWIQLLHKVNFDVEHDKLILLGDLMDRGKDSYKVFQTAITLKETMKDRMVVLKGSHEKMILDNSKKIKDRILWRIVGKGATLRSFRRYGENMQETVEWFKKHCVPYYETVGFQCVHAAVKNEKLAEQDEYTLLMDHKLTRRNLYGGKLTVTGHIHLKEPTWFDGTGGKGIRLNYRQWLSLPQAGVICIDTACAEGNKLTAMVIQGEHYYLEFV